ncbi:MAG: SpoIID/LytB domain-containing protein [Chitinophagales bacterium]
MKKLFTSIPKYSIITLLFFPILLSTAQTLSKHISGTVTNNLTNSTVSGAIIKFYKRQVRIESDGTVSILPIKEATLFRTTQTNLSGQYQLDLPLTGSNNDFYFIEITANQYSPSCKLFYNPIIQSSNSLNFLLQKANLTPIEIQQIEDNAWNEKVANNISGTDTSPANEIYDPNNLPPSGSRTTCTFQVPAQVHVNHLVNGNNAQQCNSGGFTGNMPFDEFLAGNLRAEFSIGQSYSEAMKAHAIASRSYAQYNINSGSSANCGHAYSDDIANYPVYMNAVNATSGMVMTYNGTGNVIKAYYSARCNGDYTQNSYEAQCSQNGYGYLPYCLSKPCSGHINCTQVPGEVNSGYCCAVTVSTTGSPGHIYGHGAGLCQRGAVRYASNFGYTYDQILNAYYTDICITDPNNSITNTLDCANAPTLQCGQTYSYPASNAQSNVTTYGCNNWTETGPERVHKVIPTQNGTLTATISNYTGDLDVFILSGCDPSTCVGSVGSYYATLNNAVAGHTYYVVVDADDGSTSGYNIQITCPSNSVQTLNCNNAIPLTSGQPYTGSTTTGSSVVSQYGCNTWNESGSEIVHSITLPSTGTLTCSLTGMSSDLDLFILDACNQSSCVNVFDNNGTTTLSAGTYYLVVDGYNGASGSYTLTATFNNQNNGGGNNLICNNAVSVTCGQHYNGSTSGGASNVNLYPCQSTWNESGPEIVHQVTVSNTGTLTATLSNLNGTDLDVFILSSCDVNSCMASGNTTATLTNAMPGTYYIVVDGYLGASGSYSLDITCANANNSTALDCINAQSINCGQVYNGNTTGGNSNVSTYSGTTWNESGPERVYSFTTVSQGDISAELTNLNGIDLDVFILSGCNPANCIAVGNTTATASNAPAGMYYIVVDGYNGAVGSYSLSVICPNTTPQQPSLVFPPNTSYQGTTSIQFQWLPVSGATKYEFQLAYDNSFSNIFSSSSTIYNEQISIAGLPNDGTIFYWRVRAYNNGGWGSWSLIFSFNNSLQPTSQSTKFIKYYGDVLETEGWAKVLQTQNNDYWLCGWTPTGQYSPPPSPISLVKVDENGNLIWSKKYRTSTLDFDGGAEVSFKFTSDGGAILCSGIYDVNIFGDHVVLVKVDAAGNVQWSKRYSNPSGIDGFFPFQVSQTQDGGYFVSGMSSANYGCWFKTDGSGNLIWSKKSPDLSAYNRSHIVNSNGVLIQSGSKLVQIDNAGNNIWSKSYTNIYNGSRVISFNGSYLISGTKQITTGQNEACFIKVDASGSVIWSKAYEIVGYQELDYSEIAATLDGGFVMLTKFTNPGMPNQVLLLKFDATGNFVWKSGINSGINGGDIIVTNDDGILVSGIGNYMSLAADNVLVKFDNFGQTYCNNFSSYSVSNDGGYSTIATTLIPSISNLTLNVSSETISVVNNGVSHSECSDIFILGNIHTKANAPINAVDVAITGGSGCSYTTLEDGNYQCSSLTAGASYVITPTKDGEDDNGITVQDLVLIQQHISGTLPINNPYNIIAADVNGSNSVDNTDLSILQQFTLGQITVLPVNSWQFVPAGYNFPNPSNPFPFPSTIQLNNLTSTASNQDFIGIKLGDIDNDVDPSRDNSQEAVKIVLTDYSLAEGANVSLPIRIENFKIRRGLQFELFIDPNYIEITGMQTAGVPSVSNANFGLVNSNKGEVRFLWYDPNGQIANIAGGTSIFNLNFVVKRPIDKLSDVIRIQLSPLKAEVLNGNYTCSPVILEFEKNNTAYNGITEETYEQNDYVLIVPNPTHNSATLHVNSSVAESSVLRFFDYAGSLIAVKDVKLIEGYNKIELPEVELLSSGMYFCTLTLSNSSISVKFVKD